ncbi:DUF2087 domain-containing protein [Desmospora activa]|uniref:Transcriptional regulator n=1 Tax=Desmospora activa DSM 45169 TaxID=1121389 RepID=A0A2T4ZA17_9BACL|nr:DUF2087 domain-containing protein [Desmospora activa]PTM58731.1 transcriptional regulator [Desmospora activa DSM 45169]
MTIERFWTASVEELKQGFIYEKASGHYTCLLCQERFEEGVIYPIDGTLYEAKKAIVFHVNRAHGSMFEHLLAMGKKYTGLSEHQKELLRYFKQGLSDKEIVAELNGGSTSTIRNHRFKFKEKEKQAKVFLAIMGLLKDEKNVGDDEFIDIHSGATMVDERYAITVMERDKVLETYFQNGRLKTFPSKEKRKIIVLQYILNRFEPDKIYTEKEVNQILSSIYEDFATIRRYLIEYGFMDRNKDGSQYWIKN